MNLQNNEWICTDGTQWRKQLDETTFHLVEIREFVPDKYVYVSGIIDINDYSDSEKDSIIKGYYPSMEEFIKTYPNEELNGILAECIFEQTPEIELNCSELFETEEQAEVHALKYIAIQEDSKITL